MIERYEIGVAEVSREDKEKICRLAQEIWYLHYPGVITVAQINYMLGQRYTTSAIELSDENSNSWWLKVLVDQAIQGFAHFEFHKSLNKAKLDKLYVHPRAHRIGCARKLLGYAEHQLSKSGIEHITLQVNKGNVGSIKCYERLGYSKMEDIVVDIGNGYVMDDFIMSKKIERSLT